MRKLSKGEVMILQRAIGDDRSFKLLQEIASEVLVSMAAGPMIEDTAFKTARNAIGREERKRALQVFLQELEKLTHGQV